MRWIAVFLVLCAALPSSANQLNPTDIEDRVEATSAFVPTVILTLTWGDGPSEVGLHRLPDANHGPVSFAIDEEQQIVHLLDPVNGRVVSVSFDGVPHSVTPVDAAMASIAVLPGNRIAVLERWQPLIHCLELGGGSCGSLEAPEGFRPAAFRVDARGNIRALQADGSSFPVDVDTARSWPLRSGPVTPSEAGGVALSAEEMFIVRREPRHEAPVRTLSGGRGARFLNILSAEGRVESTLLLGEGGSGEVYVVVDESDATGAVYRSLRRYDANSLLKNYAAIPTSGVSHPLDDLLVTPSGDVYQLLPHENGVDIVRWQPGTAGGRLREGATIRWPGSQSCADCREDISTEARGDWPIETNAVAQSSVFALAEAYTAHSFTVQSQNITPVGDARRSTVCGVDKYVRTPTPFRTTGTKTGVPYKWGGFNGIPSSSYTSCGVWFNDGLSSGLFAGDIRTDDVNGNTACESCSAVGVDCSGFVSQTWGLTNGTRLSTSGIKDPNNANYDLVCALPAIPDMLPGDIVSVNNSQRNHMRLFLRRQVGGTYDGRFVFYESAGSSNTDFRVGINTVPYSLSTLQSEGYLSYRKRTISGMFGNGDRVKALQGFNIRSCGSTSCSSLGTTVAGDEGTILGEAYVEANGYVWWRIDWDDRPTGWSVQCWLGKGSAAPQTPANDNCSNATVLQSGSSCSYTSGTVRNATASGLSKPSCDPFGSPNMFDVWYRFTASSSSHTITVDPETSIGDPVVTAYGSCGGSVLACKHDAGQGGTESLTLTGLSVGGMYYIRVYDYGSVEPVDTNADFKICVTGSNSQNYTLSVDGSGNGQGSVSGGEINCTINAGTPSGTCSQSYSSGTPVTLTASASGGSTFSGWGGNCNGTGSCNLTMTANRSVIASFNTSGGDNAGPVTSSISLSPNPTNGATSLSISASVSDSAQGSSDIHAAEFFIDTPGSSGTGTPLSASDGSFDEVTETAKGTYPIGAWAYGTSRTVYIHAQDSAGNWGTFGSSSVAVSGPCVAPTAPSLAAPTSAANGSSYVVSWTATSPDGHYEWDEATDSVFSPTAITAGSRGYIETSKTVAHSPSTETTYYYRVRAARVCGSTKHWSDFSNVDSTVVAGRSVGVTRVRNDVDGDDIADIFWRNNNTGETSIWFMNGATYSSAVRSTTVGAPWAPAVSGDFDGDTKADLFWRNPSTGGTSIWLGWNGSTFAAQVASLTIPVEWAPIGGGDIDGDGKADIFWRNSTTGETSIWFMNGATYSSAIRSTTVATSWVPTVFGDFDGDLKMDVFWRNPSTGETSIWLGWNGLAFATQIRSVTAGNGWAPAGAGDITGDARADIFWRNATSGETSVWVMNGANAPAFAITTIVPASWSPAALGDYDGDSLTDVFWRNPSTGETSMWLGWNGTRFASQVRSNTVLPTTWIPFLSR